MKKIRVGIVGYGNIGRGVELAVGASGDMELSVVLTRRDPSALTVASKNVPVAHVDDALQYQGKVDVMVLCGGSATDLPEQGPAFAATFNTVDSFDTHAKIPAYHEAMDRAAKDTVAIISVGWDPGLFSMQRLLGQAVLPEGSGHTFWGKGLSQGHSDAIRRIKGVADAVQYTIPIEAAVQAVRRGEGAGLTTRDKHLRECYVVAEADADRAQIEHSIKTMPNYFDEYDTIVHFISQEELKAQHASMAHGGFVVRSGQTGANSHVMEFAIKLDSNPEFTGSVLAAYARAAARLSGEGMTGAKTVFDVPLSYLTEMDKKTQLSQLL